MNSFKGVSIAIPVKVNLFQCIEYKFEIKATEKYLNDIKAEVYGDVVVRVTALVDFKVSGTGGVRQVK